MEKKATKDIWRFERKFALSFQEYLQFEKLLMLSDLEVLYEDRQINNCYLDSIKHDAYTASIEGYREKMKTRIRWYGETFQTITPTLEYKIKQNHSNKKELFKLYEVAFDTSTNWVEYIASVRHYLFKQYNQELLPHLEPVLINSYLRSYYSDFRKTFRLTVDKQLKFMSPIGTLKNQQPVCMDQYIIELKFNNDQIIHNFPLLKNLGKFSKFTTGITLLR